MRASHAILEQTVKRAILEQAVRTQAQTLERSGHQPARLAESPEYSSEKVGGDDLV